MEMIKGLVMMRQAGLGVVVGLVAACGGDDGSMDSASAGWTISTTHLTATESAGPTGTASNTESSAGSMSDSMTDSSGTVTTSESTGIDSDTSTSTGTDSDTSTGTDSDTDTVEPCPTNEEPDFSYIWIANSNQGTISKIDTQTLEEKGRYIVRPDSLGTPSRTSVNLSGDVVVANRKGGLTKVFARETDCVESNGIPGIQTSTNGTALPWGEEECLAWHTPMDYLSQRPAAWTQGTYNKEKCAWEDQKVWTSGASPGQLPGLDILRLNGETGVIEEKLSFPDIEPGGYGMYGGAVDGEGNLWASQLGAGKLVFVDNETLESKVYQMPVGTYGIAVGASGYVWTCSDDVGRFDPMTETWETLKVGGNGGCMEDDSGTLYMSGLNNTIIAVDVETVQVKATYPVPQYVHGISIDHYGYVWGVSLGSQAYRLDINAQGAVQIFNGLVGAYSYSDMTGVGLSNVTPK